MNPTNWNFYSEDGNFLTQGWQGFEDQAHALAQKLANERQESVGYEEYGRSPDSEPTWVEPEEEEEETDLVKATLYEAGNGFPGVGDYQAGDDGELYDIVAFHGFIRTNGPGVGNSISCSLKPADWDDVDDDFESLCKCVLEKD